MNTYYTVMTTLKDLLLADEDVNTVTKNMDFDRNKKNIFPLCHIEIVDCGFAPAVVDFGIRISAMDLRNHSNVQTNDKFTGNDNEDDNLNTMLFVLYRLYQQLKNSDTLRIISFERPLPAIEVRENVLDGWVWQLRVELIETEVGAC